jgi:hypothetical protein
VHTTYEEQQRWHLDRWDAVTAVFLMIFVLALFVLFLEPPVMSDPLDYFYHAWHLDELKPTHRHQRVGLIWPLAIAIRWFGYSELSYYAIPALAALLLTSGTWMVGRLLFGRWVGLLAGIFVVYNPWVLSDFTKPLPDFLAAGLFCTGIVLVIWFWREGRLADKPIHCSTVGLLGLAGLLFGWSYLTREFVVVFFSLVAFVFVVARGRLVGLLPMTLAAFSCWLAELVWSIAKYGDALARFHAVSSTRGGWTGMYIETDPMRILTQLPSTFVDRPGGWIIVALLLGGAWFSVVRAAGGDRRWQLLALWLIGGWVFFTTVAMLPVLLLDEGRVYLRVHKLRYWALILPPMFIAGLACAQHVTNGLIKLFTGPNSSFVTTLGIRIMTIAFLVSATLSVRPSLNNSGLVRNGAADDYLEFREFMKGVVAKYELIALSHQQNRATRSIPIYLNSWNGSERVWSGAVLLAESKRLDEIAQGPGEKLIVLDLTKSRRRAEVDQEDPVKLLDCLDVNGDRFFESSSGFVIAYLISGFRKISCV